MRSDDIMDPIADPQTHRSPCVTCEIHLKGINKNNAKCDNCEEKLQFIRDNCGPITIEELVEIQENRGVFQPKTPRFDCDPEIRTCERCGKLHYKDGLCKGCHRKAQKGK